MSQVQGGTDYDYLLRLNNHAYSPAAWRQIANAAAYFSSFADATHPLNHQAKLSITPQHVHTLAQEVGEEMQQQRDAKAAKGRRRLPMSVAQTPELVAVEVDGGRLRTRVPDAGSGVHEQENKEDKIACLVTLQSKASSEDPQPEPPSSFLQPRRVERLVREMAGQAGAAEEPAAASRRRRRKRSRRSRVRTPARNRGRRGSSCEVASPAWRTARPLVGLVAAEAQERDFYRAQRKAFVADGAAYNWKLQRTHFANFEPIVDFLHVLCYVYAAAWAVEETPSARLDQYVSWLRACWQGRVQDVLTDLQQRQAQVGRPPSKEELPRTDARRAVAEALSYLSNNADRMDYPRYRREGMPITSSLAESLVGEFNARMKSRKKFWNRPEGAEAMLQLRAALLSEDGRLERYFAERPGSPYRRKAKNA